jgi:hypothetical protein
LGKVDELRTDDLRLLLDSHAGWHVSIYMPTFRAGADRQQNPIRLRNLLQQAEDSLVAHGMRAPEARDLLAPARDLIDNSLFWRQPEDGLAVFLAKEVFRSFRLPLRFEDLVVVSGQFHVKPLLPLFSGDGRYYVLAISRNGVRLFEGSRFGINELEAEFLPQGLADTLRYDEWERNLGAHGGGVQNRGQQFGAFFGYDNVKDVLKEDLLRYFHDIDHGLREYLRDKNAPLILAGVEYTFPIYREANTYPYLLNEGIPGNPDIAKAEDLRQQAWRIVQPLFEKPYRDAQERYAALVGTGLASSDPAIVVPAAAQGRVDTLLIATGCQIWGKYDEEKATVEVHAQAQPGDVDLADFAAIQTMLNRGKVFADAELRGPGEACLLAAIFRY